VAIKVEIVKKEKLLWKWSNSWQANPILEAKIPVGASPRPRPLNGSVTALWLIKTIHHLNILSSFQHLHVCPFTFSFSIFL
jgi:hypothetical protein